MIRLSRFAFYGMILVVAVGVAVYLPEPKAVGTTPSAEWITFSRDRSATEIRRDLKRAHHAEARANRRWETGSSDAPDLYRAALGHYDRAARRLRESASRRGYLHRMIRQGRRRIEGKRFNPTSTSPSGVPGDEREGDVQDG